MTIAYSGYGIPTPDSADLNRTAPRIRYRRNIYRLNNTIGHPKFYVSVTSSYYLSRNKNLVNISGYTGKTA